VFGFLNKKKKADQKELILPSAPFSKKTQQEIPHFDSFDTFQLNNTSQTQNTSFEEDFNQNIPFNNKPSNEITNTFAQQNTFEVPDFSEEYIKKDNEEANTNKNVSNKNEENFLSEILKENFLKQLAQEQKIEKTQEQQTDIISSDFSQKQFIKEKNFKEETPEQQLNNEIEIPRELLIKKTPIKNMQDSLEKYRKDELPIFQIDKETNEEELPKIEITQEKIFINKEKYKKIISKIMNTKKITDQLIINQREYTNDEINIRKQLQEINKEIESIKEKLIEIDQKIYA